MTVKVCPAKVALEDEAADELGWPHGTWVGCQRVKHDWPVRHWALANASSQAPRREDGAEVLTMRVEW